MKTIDWAVNLWLLSVLWYIDYTYCRGMPPHSAAKHKGENYGSSDRKADSAAKMMMQHKVISPCKQYRQALFINDMIFVC